MEIVYKHAKNNDGLILNCLDLPGNMELDRTLSTEKTAFMATVDLPFCGERFQFPQRTMRWALLGLAHSNSRFHMDSDGFGTHVSIRCGTKVWFLATPVGDSSVGDIEMFSPDRYSQDLPPGTHWMAEAVVLRPGSTL
jgi:hypothetical protein